MAATWAAHPLQLADRGCPKHPENGWFVMVAAEDLAGSLTGTVLDGRFRVVRLLGQGGMGAVYDAVHLRLQKPVAVKVMAHALAGNAEAIMRFQREAQVTSAIGHPHIVQVFDFGLTPEGDPFFVMELLRGEDLEQRLRRTRFLPPHSVLHILRQVGAALEAAHAQGIVHRDLKPANIFLLDVPSEPDFVKVLDFGISKVHTASRCSTEHPGLLGTPMCMAPEQILEPSAIDARTDQWGLACIAWEALVGRGPFAAHDDVTTLYRVVHEPPGRSNAGAPDLAPAVADVLRRALSKDRTARYPTVGAFIAALECAGEGGGPSVAPPVTKVLYGSPVSSPARRRSQTRLWSGLLLSTAVAVVLALLMLNADFYGKYVPEPGRSSDGVAAAEVEKAVAASSTPVVPAPGTAGAMPDVSSAPAPAPWSPEVAARRGRTKPRAAGPAIRPGPEARQGDRRARLPARIIKVL